MNNKKSLLTTLFLRKRKKDENIFKYIIGLFHLWFGLLSSIVICIICITGCIYAFKNQIIDLYNYDKVFIKNNSTNINVDEIQQYFINHQKNINSIFIPENKNRSWIISYTDSQQNLHTTYFDPHQKKELGIGDDGLDDFFQTTLNLHRTLLLGDIGRQIVGGSVLIFILLLFSGFIIWIPKKIKHLKQGLSIKFNSKFQRLNYDLHRALGVYSMIFLLFIAITGVYFTYPWVKNILITSLGGSSIEEIKDTQKTDDEFAKLMEDMLKQQEEKSESLSHKPLTLSQIIKETDKHLDYSGNLSITMPNNENPRYRIVKINSENWLRALLPDEISLDKKGELKNKDLFLEKPLHQQFTALAKPLHTGEIMGLPSIILYFLASLIGFLLPITGFIIWWNRIKKQI